MSGYIIDPFILEARADMSAEPASLIRYDTSNRDVSSQKSTRFPAAWRRGVTALALTLGGKSRKEEYPTDNKSVENDTDNSYDLARLGVVVLNALRGLFLPHD